MFDNNFGEGTTGDFSSEPESLISWVADLVALELFIKFDQWNLESVLGDHILDRSGFGFSSFVNSFDSESVGMLFLEVSSIKFELFDWLCSQVRP